MNKAISVLSTISLIVAGVSLLVAILIMTVLWEPLCSIYTSHSEVVEAGPMLPLGSAASIIGTLAVAFILFITSKGKSNVIAVEIISIALLSLVFPALSRYLGAIQTSLVGARYGAITLASLSATANVLAFSSGITSLASSLCLVTGGFRIAEKINARKQPQYL